MKNKIVLLSVLLASLPAAADWNQAYFRGTANDWQSESMVKVKPNHWQIVKKFNTGDGNNPPSFKVDRFGDWSENYPINNYVVDPNKTYEINFYDDTNTVIVHEKLPFDMRDETMYFVFLDRFHDGDSSNNTSTGANMYSADKSDFKKYFGGDLKGLTAKLDYLHDMGITAIWITPPADNINVPDSRGGAGYHGYWGRDFFKVDEHLGTVDDFKALKKKMDSYGMKLVLDYAPNHSNPDDEGEYGALYKNGVRLADYNNDSSGYYHRNGAIAANGQDWEWDDAWAVRNKTLFNLTDFDQRKGGPARQYLIDGAKFWVDLGVDAIRIDAVKHMDKEFIQDFTGQINAYAKQSQGKDFYFFGEWMDSGADATGSNFASIDFANTSGSALLDFGLRNTIENALLGHHGTGMYAINNYMKLRDQKFTSSDWQVIFLDNHDAPRLSTVLRSDATNFGPGKDKWGGRQSIPFAQDRVELGLALIMTSRGIPCIYYGTEHYAANFTTNGFGQQGNDPYNREMMPSFDKTTPAYQMIKKLSKLRKESFAIQQGSYIERWISNDVLVYERNAGDDVVVVAMNLGNSTSVNAINLGLANGTYDNVLGGDQVVVANGSATFNLDQNEVIVLHTKN
ncbi:alpha-amylase family glycosyl hydrolase [Vibrio sp. THAF190c]|uniref:alpha-amylase family glycosyl hydrolase n=1 Tax=Vibrio sp. THAF190c TaxID=2587865 RepID=UPI001268318C|nr:alpha-amylase family glycosyl hydrolase [Vibrio sp. THAF190c]QFT11803.1 Maltogenic alpha-amylase precursor [Vibrio sp. THAF190c]